MSPTPEGTVFVLAFHKAGSQWVRDVLWDPGVLAMLGRSAGLSGTEVDSWPPSDPGAIHAPVYSVDAATWDARRHSDDRAVVVLRDPRDMIASWIPSAMISHRPGAWTAVREPLRSLEAREQVLASFAWFSDRRRALESWADRASSDTVLITSYEALVADERAAFGRLVDFLGGDGGSHVVDEAVERHSFSSRSGREPGHEDVHSHYRRGVVGDWTRWFDRTTGELFEALFPDLLTSLGYEADARWFERLGSLDERPADAISTREHDDVQVELRRVQEENLMLRRTCDERLALIEELDARLREATDDGNRSDPE